MTINSIVNRVFKERHKDVWIKHISCLFQLIWNHSYWLESLDWCDLERIATQQSLFIKLFRDPFIHWETIICKKETFSSDLFRHIVFTRLCAWEKEEIRFVFLKELIWFFQLIGKEINLNLQIVTTIRFSAFWLGRGSNPLIKLALRSGITIDNEVQPSRGYC